MCVRVVRAHALVVVGGFWAHYHTSIYRTIVVVSTICCCERVRADAVVVVVGGSGSGGGGAAAAVVVVGSFFIFVLVGDCVRASGQCPCAGVPVQGWRHANRIDENKT